MFESARVALTGWYLLIIMSISLLFSFAIYSGVNGELRRMEDSREQRGGDAYDVALEKIAQNRARLGLPPLMLPRSLVIPSAEVISQARARLVTTLFIVNGSILVISGFAGYFLAGRTLRPIARMLEEQNRFVTDASHELRTPLTSLRSETEVALRDKALSLGEAKKLFHSNLEEIQKLQALSDNLIKLTQHQDRENHLATQRYWLKTVVSQAVSNVKGLAKKKNITIENRAEDVQVVMEKHSIIELFVILLDNAIKYSPPESEIVISSTTTKHLVRISVVDRGIGIPKDDLPHIFDRFYRGDKSRTKTGATGYGLGLSIAQQIVKKHGGTISVQSKAGSGTKVVVSLPHDGNSRQI